jgi:serine-type D-Ala-D-Ala carboxypeptidase/endopeptidase
VTSSVAGRLSAAIANIDAIAAAFQRKGEQPGMAYGIIADGQLLHASGLGERWIGGPAPDADTVFRIASMTKSFTAAGVLQLRDVGALHLDDPVEAYVPELSGMKGPTADSPRLTIRHLLTMAGGLPKDDAWADRQQGISDRAFSEMLRDGFSFARAPGTRYEYSNLGYAILGRVASAAAGIPYDEIIVQRLLEPLGMAHTGFVASQMPSAALAKGYRRVDDQWMERTRHGTTSSITPYAGPPVGKSSNRTTPSHWTTRHARSMSWRDAARAATAMASSWMTIPGSG